MEGTFTCAGLLLGFVVLQRLAELAWSRHNTRRLRARGGREAGREHYPLIVGLHAAWLAALAMFGWQQPLVPVFLILYLLLQPLRLWILASLGGRWTTRIIVIDEPLVRRGPYRWLRHPNYLLVAAEIAILPLALNLPWLALVFSILNAMVLWLRIHVESQALRSPGGPVPHT